MACVRDCETVLQFTQQIRGWHGHHPTDGRPQARQKVQCVPVPAPGYTMSALSIPRPRTPLFGYPRYWAECFGTAPFLPMSRAEMEQLGWDSCDIIIVTGDAYVDHPSFGMAIVGRLLEAQGFRVGIIAQPDWTSDRKS